MTMDYEDFLDSEIALPIWEELESDVRKCLGWIQAVHPEAMEVRAQPRLRPSEGNLLYPDFELVLRLSRRPTVHGMEFQFRTRDSEDLARMVRYAKSHSRYHEFYFIPLCLVQDPHRQLLRSGRIELLSWRIFVLWCVRLSAFMQILHESEELSERVARYGPFTDIPGSLLSGIDRYPERRPSIVQCPVPIGDPEEEQEVIRQLTTRARLLGDAFRDLR